MRACVRACVCVCMCVFLIHETRRLWPSASLCQVLWMYSCVFSQGVCVVPECRLSERSVRPPSAFFFFFFCCCSNPNEKVAVVVLVFRSNLYYSQRVACINAEYRNSGFCWVFFVVVFFLGGGCFCFGCCCFF